MLEALFNTALDISAFVHFIVSLPAMYIVFRYSPKSMDSLPWIILDIMTWNLLGNVFSCMLHIHPLFPAECFRFDGLMALLTTNEYVAHVLCGCIVACILNGCVALWFSFPYRYVVFVHPELFKALGKIWIFVFCASLHTAACLLVIYVSLQFFVSYGNYPIRDELPPPEGVYCFWPYGLGKNLMAIGYFLSILVTIIIVIVFSLLLRTHLVKIKNSLTRKTLELHRKFLFYLLISTTVPLIFGAVPLTISLLCAIFPHFPYSREITMITTFIAANHGTIYSVVSIVTFRPYFMVARRMVGNLFRRSSNAVQSFTVS
ncbi:hypothetical protein QR680_015503 [Steinernema hermaphroditum]|uniref:Uncharacterized protein n=1 Tax=Steinernema hermaphroditum TaxID=289476 RepID=A0AA39H877_9BILA|nr:hypothetical protein QR680_015503 [Steinernema hermaphroditum]